MATTEVAGVLSAIPAVHDVCVYGVEVKGADGKVGMACIELTDKSLGE